MAGFPPIVDSQSEGNVVISNDEDNQLREGSDGGLFVPPGIPDSASVDLQWIYLGVSGNLDPNPNYFRMNSADPSLITELYLSTVAYPNRAVENILGILNDGDRVYLQQNNSQNSFVNANILGEPVNNGSYYTIPVEVYNSSQDFDINQFCDLIIYHASGGGGNAPSQPGLKNPSFTYDGDELTQVDYDNGAFKTLQYGSNGALAFLAFDNNGIIKNKEFIYNPNGTLNNIIDT
jgi:hypothetical protein